MSKTIEDVDFDFFDTPRESVNSPPRSPGKYFDRKPPPSPTANKHGERPASGFLQDFRQKDEGRSITKPEDDIDEDIYSESFSSDTESETPRVGQGKGSSYNDKKDTKGKQYSDSSSAYSNSDYSSDDSSDKVNYNNNRKKEKIDVTVPKMKVDAWVHQSTKNDLIGGKNHKSRRSDRSQVKQKSVGNRSYSQSSESDSSNETHDSLENKKNIDRVKSAKSSEDRHMNKVRKPLRSTSSSYSNNSDITDVSPLESPEISPRVVRKQFKNTSEKENGQYDDVQYKSPEKEADIKLESDEIDLSILMKCMADIDKEKQQRLKANTRRVMFAPPSSITHDKGNQNFTFSMGRAKMIERENQRLLKQIMQHVGTGSGKQKSQTKPKKLVHAEPVVPRLTPSAVNRMREQRRIEMENLQMLNRLQKVKATSGMSRKEQLKEFEKQAAYGIPSGTVIITGDEARYETTHRGDLSSSMSRPSSAKSISSVPGGRRSRPSSAKSNASVISNASLRSNMSVRSNASKRSSVSLRSGGRSTGRKVENRPQWDDRFAYS